MALGITNRLILSYAAVAVLAAAANLIVEHGVEVIRTHHLDRGLASAPPTIDVTVYGTVGRWYVVG